MSLVVWLPMTKDLRQQGLSNVTVSIMRGNETWDNNGKLGKCFYANGVNTLQINNIIPQLYNTNGYSLCAWFYIESQNTVHSGAGIISGGNWNSQVLNLSVSDWSSDHYTRLRVSGTNWNNTYSYNFYKNIWYHAVVCSDGNKTYAYINGQLIGDTVAGFLPSSIEGNNIAIGGATYYSGMQFFGKISDVRIYDHCLSPMEVKRISQGLVLHYPLNRMGFGQDNLATCTTAQYNIAASSTSNYNYFFINSNTLEPNTTYTFSAEVEVSDNINKCTIYNYTNSSNYGSITHVFPADGKRHSWTFTTTSGAIGLIAYAGNSGATAGHSAVYRNIKIEKGNKATPYIPRSNETIYNTLGLNSNIEYDTSGYCNNGTKNNSPTYSSDTAKYTVSTHLDGNNQTIQLPNLTTLIPDSIFTFNIWFKRLEAEPSSRPWETLLGGPSGFEIETCSANNVHDNKIKAYSWGGGTIEFEFDKWNMLTMVSNGTNALFYLNGELKLTGTYKALVSGNYFIGSWSNTSTQNYKGYVCDARIYATTLSADDVKSLYQNTATIDADGTIHGAVR